MALKERENNIIIKEYDDPISNYLRNIIQRYFQIENDISQETKETIIIQAYTRLKEILNAYNNKYIICINERSGNIDLFIRDFGGEEKFDKNTAFNKDFCDITTETVTLWNDIEETYNNFGEEQADHIVAGDDDRLSDARIPLAHIHTIDEIKGLREKFEEYNLINGGFHLHTNLDVLNMLIYTESRVEIDLLLIEDLAAKVEKAVERFKETDEYFISLGQRYINQLQDIFTIIYNKLRYTDENINSWISNWLQESKNYTDIKNVSFKNYIKNLIKDYLSIDEYNTLKNILENSIYLIDEGTFDIGTNTLIISEIDSQCTETKTNTYREDQFNIKLGYTNIASIDCVSNAINNNVLNKLPNNSLLNADCKLFLEYTSDGVTYKNQLPCIYQINDSQHDFVLINGNTDSDNNINIEIKRLSCIPVYLYYPITLYAWVEDNSEKTNSSFLQIDRSDTNNISNNKIQNDTVPKLTDTITSSFAIQRVIIPETAKRIGDLDTVVAPYQNGNPGQFGAYKELLTFVPTENYTGAFNLTMNTGHWYGFAIWESDDGANFDKICDNYDRNNATHNNSNPLSLSMSNITFVSGKTYKIITEECAGGGTTADKFIYSFSTDTNFLIQVIEVKDVDVDVKLTATKNDNSCTITWVLTEKIHDDNTIITNSPGFEYILTKNSESDINCNTDTSYTDNNLDTLVPNQPNITGKCISSQNNEDVYEFVIEVSDQDEYASYSLKIYAPDTDTLNTGLLHTTNEVSVSSFSDIKQMHFNIKDDSSDFTNDEHYTLIQDNVINSKKRLIQIKKTYNPISNDTVYFCDNIFQGYKDDVIEMLSQYNCSLAEINDTNINYIQSNLLLLDNEFFEMFLPEPYFHVSDGFITKHERITTSQHNYVTSYVGEYNCNTLRTYFENAKIRYQIFTVPGKGENDA